MTIITDENHVVKSVSLIPGLGSIPSNWHCYFPAKCKDGIPAEGDTYEEPGEDIMKLPRKPVPKKHDR